MAKRILYEDKSKGPDGSELDIHNVTVYDMNHIKDVIDDHAEQLEKPLALTPEQIELLKGAPGAPGPSGKDGTSFTIKGKFDTTSQLPSSGNTTGDGYLIAGNLHVWNGASFINVGTIQGPKGDPLKFTDLTDAQKSELKGLKGDKGEKGDTGLAGKAFTFADFTSAQLTALTGPKGANGTNGTNGTNGWTPSFAAVVDGERVLVKLVDYIGGTGSKPTTGVGQYLGQLGYTTSANATDFRGAKGIDGDGGSDDREYIDEITGRKYKLVMKNGVLTPVEIILSTNLNLKSFPFPIGFALQTSFITVNRLPYMNIVKEQARSITSENDMKFSKIQKTEGVWDFSKADISMNFAEQNGLRMHGHTLLWANQDIPAWLRQYENNPTKMLQIMDDHITQVMTRYKGRIKSWDVINEPFEDNGVPARKEDGNGGYIYSPWANALGPEWYIHAFRIAQRVDPDCKLFVNQFSQEYNGNLVSSMLTMVDKIRAAGVRIDGIGYQMHTSANLNLISLKSSLQRFVAKDLIIHISELDIKSRVGQSLPYPDFMTPELDAKIAKLWKDVFQIYMETVPDHLKWGITMWSVTDKENYENVQSGIGLRDFVVLFDVNGQPKSNYYEVLKLITPTQTIIPTVLDDFTRQTRTGLKGSSATMGLKSLPWEVINTNDANADFYVGDTSIGLQVKSSTSGVYTYALLNNSKTSDEVTFKLKRTQSTVSLTSRNIGCVVRYLNDTNHFFVYVDNSGSSTHWIVSKKVDNVITKLFESTESAKAGDEINVKFSPSSIIFSLNDTVIGTAADTTLSTATKVGFRGRGLYDNYSSWESIKYK